MSTDVDDSVVMLQVTEARANEVALAVEHAVQRLAGIVEHLDISLWNGVVVANDGDTIAVRVPKAGSRRIRA